MQARQRSLEVAVLRPSKARRVSESSLSARTEPAHSTVGPAGSPWSSPRRAPYPPPFLCPPRASLSVAGATACWLCGEGYLRGPPSPPLHPTLSWVHVAGLGSELGVWTLISGCSRGRTQSPQRAKEAGVGKGAENGPFLKKICTPTAGTQRNFRSMFKDKKSQAQRGEVPSWGRGRPAQEDGEPTRRRRAAREMGGAWPGALGVCPEVRTRPSAVRLWLLVLRKP